MGIEVPDADRFEQQRPVEYDDAEELDLRDIPLLADPLDVADQHRSVPFDEDAED